MPDATPTPSLLSRRGFIAAAGVTVAGGGIALLERGGSRIALPAARAAPVGAPDLERGYRQLRRDLYANWFDDTGTRATDGRPGVRPTDGSGGPGTGTTAGIVGKTRGAFWQAAQFHEFMAGDHVLLPDPATAMRCTQELALLRAAYPLNDRTRGLGSDGSADGTINVSDDAGWKLMALHALHEVTGDAALIPAMRSAVIAINAKYRDTFNGDANQRTVGALTFSRYGMLYAVPGQDPNGQGRSTTYETGTMLGALAVYEATREAAFLAYPRIVYAGLRETLQYQGGIYYQTLQLDPAGRFDGTPYLQPIERDKGLPRQDYTGFSIGGTMRMALLAARLHAITREDRYARDVIGIVDGIGRHYLQNGCLIDDRDPWTAGVQAWRFARDAMALPGVDADGRVRAAMLATARRILATRAYVERPEIDFAGHTYSAEWSGNRAPTVQGRYVTWEQSGAAANDGRGGGQASPVQIMTQTSSAMMVQAGLLLARERA